MTSFHGLPSPKKRQFLSPPPCLCLFSLVSLPLSAHSCSPFSALVWASTSTQASFSPFRFSSLLEQATGLLSAETGATQSSGCTLKRGRRGVAFGCVEVCVNSQSFNRNAVCKRVAMATQSLALLLFTRAICCQVAGVTSPRLANVSIKSTGPCLKGLRTLRMVLLLTGGVRSFVGR